MLPIERYRRSVMASGGPFGAWLRHLLHVVVLRSIKDFPITRA